tara:strand:- start:83 stop:214 length:132 start_codon:yes stop_codon:yes gene_type:complete
MNGETKGARLKKSQFIFGIFWEGRGATPNFYISNIFLKNSDNR